MIRAAGLELTYEMFLGMMNLPENTRIIQVASESDLSSGKEAIRLPTVRLLIEHPDFDPVDEFGVVPRVKIKRDASGKWEWA